MAQAPALPQGFELPLDPRVPRLGSVDQVGEAQSPSPWHAAAHLELKTVWPPIGV